MGKADQWRELMDVRVSESRTLSVNEIYAMVDGYQATERRVAALEGALREAEWGVVRVVRVGQFRTERFASCPVCDERQEDGHEEDCAIGIALAAGAAEGASDG